MLISLFAFSYKDVKYESSKAFGFSKISGALPSFEAYLEDEFQEFVKNYSILHEQAQNLISTKPRNFKYTLMQVSDKVTNGSDDTTTTKAK